MSEAKKRTARLPVCCPRPELERMEEDVVAKDPPIDDTVNRRSAAADGFPPAAEEAMRRRDVTVFIVFVSHCICLLFISEQCTQAFFSLVAAGFVTPRRDKIHG